MYRHTGKFFQGHRLPAPSASESTAVIVIKNDIDEIESIKQEITKYIKSIDISEEVGHKFNLVIDELMTNIIYYAFDDDNEHEIEVKIQEVCNQLSIIIMDDGIPFNPFGIETPNTSLSLDERQIGGLGIHLVKSIMDEYSYHRRTGKNIITLVKWLDAENQDS